GFVIGGVSFAGYLGAIALTGSAVGIAYRRGWKRIGTVLTAIGMVWIPAATLTLAGFAIFEQARELTLKQVQISTNGILHFLSRFGLEDQIASIKQGIEWCLNHWYITLPLAELIIAIGGALLCRLVALPALYRIDATFTRSDPAEESGRRAAVSDAAISPLPVTLRNVSYRYPGAAVDALSDIDLTISPGTFVAIVVNNRSGN